MLANGENFWEAIGQRWVLSVALIPENIHETGKWPILQLKSKTNFFLGIQGGMSYLQSLYSQQAMYIGGNGI